MRVSAENPAFGTPLIGFPEHKNFMSQPPNALSTTNVYLKKEYISKTHE
ncbi:hypothetical protein [Staphylococcus schweitzeri]|nr:hypothetical protein [Staphylococcus schweitzeri]